MKANINYESPKENRSFGIVMAVAVVVIAFVRVAHHYYVARELYFPSYWWFVVAAAFLVPALTVPRVLKPFYWCWMQFAFGINYVVTHVLLTLVFLLMMTPMRFFKSLSKKDPLRRNWDSSAQSYWEEPEEQHEELERYKDQF